MYPGYVYKSGIKFVRVIASYADALVAHNNGEIICINYFPDKPSRVMGPFYDPTRHNQRGFDTLGKDSIWFVADVPAGYTDPTFV